MKQEIMPVHFIDSHLALWSSGKHSALGPDSAEPES